MEQMPEVIALTLVDPDEIFREPDNPDTIRLYYRWFQDTRAGGQLICVTVRVFESDAFVLTSHIASHIKGNELIWTRSSG